MSSRTQYRLIFVAHNGPGPWPCVFCDILITLGEKFHVHHKDHDHGNESPENLGACHPSCHQGYHGSQPMRRYPVKPEVQRLGVIAAHTPEANNKRKRSIAKARAEGRMQQPKENCRKGHSKTGDNLYVNPGSGQRVCRTCLRVWQADYKARKEEL